MKIINMSTRSVLPEVAESAVAAIRGRPLSLHENDEICCSVLAKQKNMYWLKRSLTIPANNFLGNLHRRYQLFTRIRPVTIFTSGLAMMVPLVISAMIMSWQKWLRKWLRSISEHTWNVYELHTRSNKNTRKALFQMGNGLRASEKWNR